MSTVYHHGSVRLFAEIGIAAATAAAAAAAAGPAAADASGGGSGGCLLLWVNRNEHEWLFDV